MYRYENQQAVALARATRAAVYAEREAAVRKLEEGRLFVKILEQRLGEVQLKLAEADEQQSLVNELAVSNEIGDKPNGFFRKEVDTSDSQRVQRWGNEVAIANLVGNDSEVLDITKVGKAVGHPFPTTGEDEAEGTISASVGSMGAEGISDSSNNSVLIESSSSILPVESDA